MTIAQMREKLTKENNATSTCPLCSGIFAWVSSHAAQELEDQGRKRITPWWRTVKAKGELNPKYPGGMEEQAKRLRKEGHKIEKRGKRWFVEGVAQYARLEPSPRCQFKYALLTTAFPPWVG